MRKKLRDRQTVFGAWTSLGHPSIAEAFCRTGVDFIGIDLEHSTISLEQAQRIIAAAQANQTTCLARLSSHNGEQIRRLLDAGADGVLVPNVTSHEEVARIVQWMKYPPTGRRGFGVARAQGYGFDFDSYVSGWNPRSVLILQLESIAGVEAAEELLSHPEVDGAMVGPYDISGSLGIPGRLTDPAISKACDRVVQVCRKLGKACGTQVVDPDAQKVGDALKAGYTFVVLASDVFLLWKWGERMRALIRGIPR